MSGKLIIFSAPSGAGKSTLVQHLIKYDLDLEFSVSATSRAPRGNEVNGVDYYYMTPDEFRSRIANNEFLEYEEVYPNCFYGTLLSEVDRILAKGRNVIFDVDVVGGLNIKNHYKDKALAIFVSPPSIETLRHRLQGRATDTDEMIQKRVGKAEFEMSFGQKFDVIIVNDQLEKAKVETLEIVAEFLK